MKERVLTALALIPVVLAAVLLASPWPLVVVLIAVAAIASHEAAALTDTNEIAVAAGAIVFLAIGFAASEHPNFIGAMGTVVFVALGCLAASHHSHRLVSPFVGAWIGGPLAAILILHAACLHESLFDLRAPVLLAFLPLWAGDTAAIFVGKAIGKHPFAREISPKKTWEGAIGNLVACLAVAIPLAHGIGFSYGVGIACGLAAGVMGQAGDLFESALKRKTGLKDSGALLPGHGGLLDRIDSLLFVAPAIALICMR